ncbi:LysR family transcriptional regulator [Phenylobacterium immobile]|uniref:LysR family transcriptional regulator n=1 Tax=Phenylobacterium immobile TaxID=21 RepID=UPI000B0116D2|nr:LysR family transcriptional regulator [Phenylobacterium immobile]
MLPDLNLLRVFDVLLQERSVTRTGARLGLSQSAVSHALNRLRLSLGDELFVRGPSGMKLTPRAIEIGARLHEPLAQLQAAFGARAFDPANSRRRFNLVAGSYASLIFLPPLARMVSERAPHIDLNIMAFGPDFVDRLDNREADVVIASFIATPDHYLREPLIREDLIWAVSPNSRLAAKDYVTLADIAATPHVTVDAREAVEGASQRGFHMRATWEDAGALELALGAAGLSRRIAVTAPDTYAALAVVSRSEFATLAPQRLVKAWANAGRIKTIEPPYPSAPAEITLVQRRDSAEETPTAWLRSLIHEAALEL